MLFRILKQAQVTFSKDLNKDLLLHNIANLKAIIDLVKFNDFHLSNNVISRKCWSSTPNKAPCTYVNIYEGTDYTASVNRRIAIKA